MKYEKVTNTICPEWTADTTREKSYQYPLQNGHPYQLYRMTINTHCAERLLPVQNDHKYKSAE
jgi:hypothetical protein